MKIKKDVVKMIALALSAVLLSCSVIYAGTVPVSASSSAELETNGEAISYVDVGLEKIADIVLAKEGVVAKYEVLSDVVSDYCRLLVDGFTGVYSNIGGTDVTYDRDGFSAALDAQGVTGYKKEILMEQYDLCCEDGSLGWLENLLTLDGTGTALKRYLVGEGITSGETYTIPQEMAQDIVDTFDAWWSDEGDFYVIRTLPFSYLDNLSKWKYAEAYREYKEFYDDVVDDKVYFMIPSGGSSSGNFYNLKFIDVNDSTLYLTYRYLSGSSKNYMVKGINSDWSATKFKTTGVLTYSGASDDEKMWYVNFSEASFTSTTEAFEFSLPFNPSLQYNYFYSKEVRYIRAFRNITAAKAHTVGEQLVYFSSGYTGNAEGSTTFTGDYYSDTSSSYTHSEVQENINNSVDESTEITDSIVDSVVDNSVTDIVNNYTYVTDDTGGSSGSGSGGSGSGDSSIDMDGFFSGVGDVVQFILDFFGNILSVVTTLADGILGLIGSLTDVFSGFTGLLGSVFTFIPEEIIDIITAGIGAVVLIAVWKAFKGG